jgi:hypothetical protein
MREWKNVLKMWKTLREKFGVEKWKIFQSPFLNFLSRFSGYSNNFLLASHQRYKKEDKNFESFREKYCMKRISSYV